MNWKNTRQIILISLLFITPVGLFSKFYTGMGDRWLNNYAGGIFYEIFWCLFFFWFIPKKQAILLIPLWVFLITSLLEILQLWHPPILTLIRSFLLGRLLIGTSFSWWDFPHYIIGCVLGYLWLKLIWRISKVEGY